MQPEVENAGAHAPDPAEPPGAAAEPAGEVDGASASVSDDAAWAEVVAAWDDEARHRAYLARFTDLEGFAVAGGRYRDVLRERPQDALALRFRDEVVRRATIHGLAAFPRTSPDVARGRKIVRALAVALMVALAIGVFLATRSLVALLRVRS